MKTLALMLIFVPQVIFAQQVGDTEAVKFDSNNAAAYNKRGLAWFEIRKFEEAIEDFTSAIQVESMNASFYNNRGLAWTRENDFAKAIMDYNEAIRLEPKQSRAYERLCLLYGTWIEEESDLFDLKKAVGYGRTACELTDWSDHDCLSAVAIAYWRLGESENAIRFMVKAIEVANDQEYDATDYTGLLEIFRERGR